MATYVPNATQATEPVESRTIESAALEFRTLKGSVNDRVDALQADIDAEIADRLADAAALQAEVDAVEVRTLALEQLAFNGSTPGAVTVQRFACNGVQTVFVLAVTPVTLTAVDAYINGVYQNHDTFSVSGNTITFTEAPTAGAVLEMQLSVPLQLGVTTADAVEYIPAGTGAVATTVQSKLREFVSVKNFGATGNGSTFDSDAIDAAMAVSQYVYFPPGQYRISRPIIWLNHWLVGAVDNGILSLSNNQTMILADGTFPAFKYQHPNGFNSHGGGIKGFNVYFADGTEPATVSTRPNAIGFLCDGTAGYPAFHTLENITVRGGQWAVFDTSGSWMGMYKHIQSHDCIGGIYKRYGTTHTFENCYHRNGRAGWWFQDVLGVTLNGCAVDLVDVNTAGYYAFFVESSGVVANGCDFEGTTIAADYREIVRVNGSNAFLQMNGCRFLDSTLNAATEVYGVYATNGAKVQLNGVNFTPTNYVGSSGVFAYLASTGGSNIEASQSTFPALTGGTPSGAYTSLATTGSVDYNSSAASYQWQGNSRKALKGITGSVFYNFGTLNPSTGSGVNQSIPGAAVGDFVMVIPQSSIPLGVVFMASVVSADTVNITAWNVSGSAQTVGAIAINIRVVQT